MNNGNGVGAQLGPFINDIFEQTEVAAITVDPRFSFATPISVSMDFSMLQDDFIGDTSSFVAGTDCCVSGFANLGDLPSYTASVSSALTNRYWSQGVMANNVGNSVNPGSSGISTGLLTDGNTMIGNFAGANAGFSPSIVPQATLPVTNPITCATCLTVTGPDGVANSALEIQTTSGGGWQGATAGTTSVGTYPGDLIIFGANCMPGTGETILGGFYGFNRLIDLETSGTDTFVTNPNAVSARVYGGALIPLTNPTWQKCVSIAQIATGESIAHTLSFKLYSPASGTSVGNRFYDWFWMDVPGPNNPSYAGVTQQEAVRWAEEVLKGYVPGGASTGRLYGNYPLALQIATTSIAGTSGTASCAQNSQGTVKQASCYLNGYAQTGTAQTYTFPTAFSAAPVLLESGGSCGTYNPTATATTLTLPANASMTAETCNVVVMGQ
ncbi:MAG: hypothetical protein ACRD25_03345 [Terracidiphilus sp.]